MFVAPLLVNQLAWSLFSLHVGDERRRVEVGFCRKCSEKLEISWPSSWKVRDCILERAVRLLDNYQFQTSKFDTSLSVLKGCAL